MDHLLNRKLSGSFDRRLARAVSHVSKWWLPANPEVYDRIITALERNQRVTAVIASEIRSDIALFLYIIKCFAQELKLNSDSDPLRNISAIELLQALDSAQYQLFQHPWQQISQDQTKTFENALVAATTSEVLFACQGFNPCSGFDTAQLRQMGLELVAFNYSSAFEAAVSRDLNSQNNIAEVQLSDKLAEQLGFTPEELVSGLVNSWSLADNFKTLIVTDEITRETELLELAESLARSNLPELYPTAKLEWLETEKRLKSSLGASPLPILRKRLASTSLQYSKVGVFSDLQEPIILDPYVKILAQERKSSSYQEISPYLVLCTEQLQLAIYAWYDRKNEGWSNKNLLEALVRHVIPATGFSGLIIYTYESFLESLVPQFTWGEFKLRSMSPVQCGSSGHIVSLAYDDEELVYSTSRGHLSKQRVLSGNQHDLHDHNRIAIASVLGQVSRAGVVYAEIPDREELIPSIEPHFRIIRRIIQDVLVLR